MHSIHLSNLVSNFSSTCSLKFGNDSYFLLGFNLKHWAECSKVANFFTSGSVDGALLDVWFALILKHSSVLSTSFFVLNKDFEIRSEFFSLRLHLKERSNSFRNLFKCSRCKSLEMFICCNQSQTIAFLNWIIYVTKIHILIVNPCCAKLDLLVFVFFACLVSISVILWISSDRLELKTIASSKKLIIVKKNL